MSVITEREWRRRAARASRPRPRCWGAQYLLKRERAFYDDRAFHALMLLTALLLALAMPCLAPVARPAEEYPVAKAPAGSALKVRAVSDVGYYSLPEGLQSRPVLYTREQLLRGRLMLLDSEHPLPYSAPAPNTLSVAAQGRGMVPVRDLGVKSGKQTIDALARLFGYARGRGIGGLSVWRGTLSPAEQQELRLALMREYALQMSLDEAAARALEDTDAPLCSEAQQEYAVEIRLVIGADGTPDERPLGATGQGRFLLQNAWRFGFVRSDPKARHFRFRYVGEAHSTAMTYLDLDLKSYIALLHERRMLTISKDGAPRYIILCAPISGTHIEFSVPDNARCEASLDNTGWAVVACTLE